ncbi:hypothetical protein D3C78_614350 [compost metagenome]
MDILPEIGHAAITAGERTIIFRPTLARISQAGSPAGIVDLAAVLLSPPMQVEHEWRQAQVYREHWRAQLGAALTLLYCCADDPDPLPEILGTLVPPRRYRRGLASPQAVILLGQQMARHGVVGVLPPEESPAPAEAREAYAPEFHAVEMAALAQAHLGVSMDEAWGMTMTALARGLAAKFPRPKEGKGAPMTLAESDRALAWLEKVNEARANG